MNYLIKQVITAVLLLLSITFSSAQTTPLYHDANAPEDARVNDLLHTLTLKEKIDMLGYVSPGVQRLDIPAYNWWNEGLHGVARAGEATVFPQAIGMAASFNDSLLHDVAAAISTEARAKYNLSVAMNRRLWYMGLTFWSPNINIFRDPRWGRGQETYGEDPFLTATMGTAYVTGMQGSDPTYLKVAACAKHFAVHSGPEADRHSFNAIIDEKDLRETYLYAFHKLVNAGVASVMCAYNRVNGEPCCISETLLQTILQKEWNYKGQLVTDCGALNDIIDGHKMFDNKAALAAAAIKAGINLECGSILQSDVQAALDKKLLTEGDVNNALRGNLRTQMKLGFYDSAATNPYSSYGADSVNNNYHRKLALQMAEESMVLLKNDGILPLQKDNYASIMVAGANAASSEVLFGNYHGVNNNMHTFVEGIAKAAGPATAVNYDQGSDYTDTARFGGIWAAGNSDITIAVIGLTPVLEGEEGDAFLSLSGGDKATLSLPKPHILFLQKLRAATKKPIVAVVTAGSDVDIAAIAPYADAVILAWYPGEEGGTALANILFGNVSPSGRLPVTFYKSLSDLPDYKDYNMQGRTYRYFTKPVQYPFGYGLSYTSFDYTWKQQPLAAYTLKDTIRFAVQVRNTGAMDGNEVVQAYIAYPNSKDMPVKELKALKKVAVSKNGTTNVTLHIPMSELQKWDAQQHGWKLYKGTYTIAIAKNANEYILQKTFTVK
ncbi:glycosyl hydrolase [Ilyomonas limi]|uniref:Glycosyl hydrolase n=1 Tax=Ilyomonas limi TaxID=2575867 RepID=A0A4U3LAI8_9BACT|nr:glycoside hydrolase family 3 N-terminal domain-containing protein [Ilyomonas limi]TKK71699.1 glycosyl hydrolase [Ilyomonas limi]